MESRINLKVPKEVHTAARIYALQQGLTLAQVVTEALRRFLNIEDAGEPDREAKPDREANREAKP